MLDVAPLVPGRNDELVHKAHEALLLARPVDSALDPAIIRQQSPPLQSSPSGARPSSERKAAALDNEAPPRKLSGHAEGIDGRLAQTQPSESPTSAQDPSVSDDAAGVLVRLKDQSPTTNHAQPCAHINGLNSIGGEPSATSPTRLPQLGTAPQQLLAAAPPDQLASRPASSVTTAPGQTNLPPLRQVADLAPPHSPHLQLNDLAEAAQSLNSQKNGLRRQSAPVLSMNNSGTRQPSPPLYPDFVASHASARASVAYPATHGQPTPPSSGPYTASPPSSYGETPHIDSFHRPREYSSMSPPPAPGHPNPHPYYYGCRLSQASENGPPFGPPGSSEGSHNLLPHTPVAAIANGVAAVDVLGSSMPGAAVENRTEVHQGAQSSPQRQSNGNIAPGSFKCTHPGCNVAPFHTQYLLNSHLNVHSTERPHYCPVKGCPRSEGGRGFKRKNEMIRHGLVHESPGYICPFCSDREHRYPRPDNLQRHVRVHHPDRHKDDAVLREILNQRPEGGSRSRRRRTAR